jgi:hypothetical protein
MLTKKELKTLKEKLPEKWMDTLMERTGFSYSYVNKVMNGWSKCQKVVDSAFALLGSTKKNWSNKKNNWTHEQITPRNRK